MSEPPTATAGVEPDTSADVDLLELEFFGHATSSVVDEMEVNLSRTGYSPLIYEYKDYCVGLLTEDFKLLTQSRGSLPIFLSDLGAPVADAVSVIGADNLAPGDVFITNYAPVCGQHLNNIVMAQPIFAGAAIVGYVAIRAHWADVGGMAPGSLCWDATDVYQEGVQYRGLKIAAGDRLVPEAVATIRANTRMPVYVMGDMMAQLTACRLGLRRWEERIAVRWSVEEIRELTRIQWRSSAELSEARIRELPDGEYHAECHLDDSGRPGTPQLAVAVDVTIEGGRMTVDLRGLPPQVSSPMNAGTTGGGHSVAKVAFKSILASDRPADEGLFEPLEIVTQPGTIMSASDDAPLGHWNSTLPTIIDVILRAVGEGAPEAVPAGHHGSVNGIVFYGLDDEGRRWHFIDTHGGGWGGSHDRDGFSPLKTIFHGDNRDIPVEFVEARFPMRVERYGFIPNSAGRGCHNGGSGTEKLIELLGDCHLEGSVDRTLDPAWGLAGGESGSPGDLRVKFPGSDEWESHMKASRLFLPAGTCVSLVSGGGGGWGPFAERSAAARAADVESGLMTHEDVDADG